MIPKTREDAAIALKVCANAHGDRFDATACAIACAIHENPDRDVGAALDVLEQLTHLAKVRAPRSAQGFAALMFGELGFSGGSGDYDDPAQADLIDILTNKSGLPVGLGHVWRHAARAIDAPLHGTDTPGHFVMRLETDDAPVFLDPYEGGAILDVDALNEIAFRAQLKALSPRMLSPVSDRVMAVRLQTNLVARARARGDAQGWFRAAFRRSALAPHNYEVALDYSNAAEAAGHLKTALEWAQRAVEMPGAPPVKDQNSADERSQALRRKLN